MKHILAILLSALSFQLSALGQFFNYPAQGPTTAQFLTVSNAVSTNMVTLSGSQTIAGSKTLTGNLISTGSTNQFPSIYIGGLTASFPMLTRATTSAKFTLADGSGNAVVIAKSFGDVAPSATEALRFERTAGVQSVLQTDSTAAADHPVYRLYRKRAASFTLNAGDICGGISCNTVSFFQGIAAASSSGGFSTIDWQWKTMNAAGTTAERMRLTAEGVLQLNQTTTGGTPDANTARVFVKDDAGTARVYTMAEDGTEFLVSPHAKGSPGNAVDGNDPDPVVFHESNAFLGRERFIHITAAVREIEKLTGKQFIFDRDIPKQDWAASQARLKKQADDARADDEKELARWAADPRPDKGPRPAVRPAFRSKPNPFK